VQKIVKDRSTVRYYREPSSTCRK